MTPTQLDERWTLPKGNVSRHSVTTAMEGNGKECVTPELFWGRVDAGKLVCATFTSGRSVRWCFHVRDPE